MLISKALTIAVLVIFSYLIKNSTNVVNTFVSNEGKYHTIYHKRIKDNYKSRKASRST